MENTEITWHDIAAAMIVGIGLGLLIALNI
jgi:uncharacterized membrane-anchored protein YhcB (DUF1043 family)